MNEDFITGLRGDLVSAMERYEQRRPAARAAAAVRSLGLRPMMAAVAVAATVVALVVAAEHLPQPQERPAHAKVVGKVDGMLVDAAAGDGSLWIARLDGRIVRVEPGSSEIRSSTRAVEDVQRLAVAPDAIWVRGGEQHRGSRTVTPLAALDPRSGRVIARLTITGGRGLSATPGAAWAPVDRNGVPAAIERVDLASAKPTATVRLPGVNGVAAGPDAVWAVTGDGTVARIDLQRAVVTQRFPQAAPQFDATISSEHAIVAERGGAWVMSTERGQILHFSARGIDRVIPVPADTRATLARTSDALWVTSSDAGGDHNRLYRIDPRSGEFGEPIDLGDRQAAGLLADGDHLDVITPLGQVLRVER